ncbi:acetylglutamate kinase [Streptomyces sp. NPDC051567]|uniref:acetylglutamate kinase n=1 Tax=Streptomyces sp. NPDC051567 TaxID=3365660 RepID=UPI003793F7D3
MSEPGHGRGGRGPLAVVKLGGSVMGEPATLRAFAEDVWRLRRSGRRVLVVHGGGPQISTHLRARGVEPAFVDGLRVTTPQMLDEVRMVMAGKLQRELVGLINAYGPLAVGLTGEDAHTLAAAPRRHTTADGREVELGRVGDIVRVETGLLRTLLAAGRVPVVSGIARSTDGGVLNVNADTVAAALAVSLKARTLVLLTDVEGLYAGPEARVVRRLSAGELAELLPEIGGGMAPKAAACLRAVDAGVREVRMLPGLAPHVLARSVLDGEELGTTVVSDPARQEVPAGNPVLPGGSPVQRIIVAGISGAGKTTLARGLSRRLSIPHTEMDGLFYGPGWTPRAEFEHDVREMAAGARWICDGQYHWVIGDLVWQRADCVIWLDLPRRTVLARLVRRSLWRVAGRRRLYGGNVETWRSLLFNPDHPVRRVLDLYAQRRRETQEQLARHPGVRVVRLTSGRQARRWLRAVADGAPPG